LEGLGQSYLPRALESKQSACEFFVRVAAHWPNDPEDVLEYLHACATRWPDLSPRTKIRIVEEYRRIDTETKKADSRIKSSKTQAKEPTSGNQKTSEPASEVIGLDKASPWAEPASPENASTSDESFSKLEEAINQAAIDKLNGRESMLRNIRGPTDEPIKTDVVEVANRTLESGSAKAAGRLNQTKSGKAVDQMLATALKVENPNKHKKKENSFFKLPTAETYDQNGALLQEEKEVNKAIAKPRKKSPQSIFKNMMKTKMDKIVGQISQEELDMGLKTEAASDSEGTTAQTKEDWKISGPSTQEDIDMQAKLGARLTPEAVGKFLYAMKATQASGESNQVSSMTGNEAESFANSCNQNELSYADLCDKYAVKGGVEEVSPEGVVDLEESPSDGSSNEQDQIDHQQRTSHPFPKQTLPHSAEQEAQVTLPNRQAWTQKKIEACEDDLVMLWGQFDMPT
jgi:hypothetical protein